MTRNGPPGEVLDVVDIGIAAPGPGEVRVLVAEGVSVFRAPAESDDAEATAFLLTCQTSHLALFRRGRLPAGETLVVARSSGGGCPCRTRGRRWTSTRRGAPAAAPS